MTHIDVSDGATGLQPLADVEDAVTWAMVESSPDGMLLANEHGVISLVNAQIEALFGYDRGDLLGCKVEKLLPKRHRQVHTAHRTRYRASPQPRAMGDDLKLMGLRQDGSEFPVEVSLSPITTNEGLRVVATVRDITDRLDAEAHRHAVLGMIDAAHDAVFMFTPDTLRFTYVNDGAALQLGYTCDELLSMSPLHINPEFSETSFKQLLEPIVGGEVDSHTFTTTHRPKNGIDIPVEISLDYPPAASPGKPRLVVALVRDISDRIEAEEAMRQSEASLRLLEDRERLARDLHDLVIQRLFAAGMGLQAVQSSIENRRAAKRVSDTITELDHTIGELRTAIFRLTNSTSDTIVDRIANVMEHATTQLGYVPAISFNGDPETIPALLCEQLLPALTEALSNVARHAQATRVDVTLTVDPRNVHLMVTDDGVGINPDAPRGNGLDNLTTRARSLGGTVTIESRPDNGTTLVWTTPR
jgi:PAS domain S-box-containing protein